MNVGLIILVLVLPRCFLLKHSCPPPHPMSLLGCRESTCVLVTPSFISAKRTFYVLPLLLSVDITQVQEGVPFSGHLGAVNSLT